MGLRIVNLVGRLLAGNVRWHTTSVVVNGKLVEYRYAHVTNWFGRWMLEQGHKAFACGERVHIYDGETHLRRLVHEGYHVGFQWREQGAAFIFTYLRDPEAAEQPAREAAEGL